VSARSRFANYVRVRAVCSNRRQPLGHGRGCY
jgi:hypothetical protein